jgi:hypothetical protein
MPIAHTRKWVLMHNNEVVKSLMAVLQLMLTAIAGYAVTEMKEISHSINTLNVQMAVMLAESTNRKMQDQIIEKRLHELEKVLLQAKSKGAEN